MQTKGTNANHPGSMQKNTRQTNKKSRKPSRQQTNRNHWQEIEGDRDQIKIGQRKQSRHDEEVQSRQIKTDSRQTTKQATGMLTMQAESSHKTRE